MKAMTDGAILARLCGNVTAGRFDWRKYCTPQTYFGREVCVTPLLCSYGQIGYAVHFPYSDMPEVEYDWELNSLTIHGFGIFGYFTDERRLEIPVFSRDITPCVRKEDILPFGIKTLCHNPICPLSCVL